MLPRVLTAVIGAPLALAALFVLPRPGFLLLVAALVLVAAAEFARLGRAAGAGDALIWLPAAVALAALLLIERPPWGGGLDWAVDPGARLGLLAGLVAVAVALLALWSKGTMRERALTAGFLGFGALYLGLPIAAFDQLRARDPWLVVLLLATVWLTDSGAFLVGSRWGRRRLAPEVSPNKSWEGAWGGLGLGLLAAAALSWWRLGAVEPTWLLAGLAVSVTGQLGDLVESMFKRSAGVKDSGSLLPGHGGMLDRLDSLIMAAPVLELLCRWFPPTSN